MTPDEAIALINKELNLQAVRTNTNTEVKCWPPSTEGGVDKSYLSAADCRRLSDAFAVLAASLDGSKEHG